MLYVEQLYALVHNKDGDNSLKTLNDEVILINKEMPKLF